MMRSCSWLCRVQLIIWGLSCAYASEVDIRHYAFQREADNFGVSITARIEAPIGAVYETLTDYSKLQCLNPVIIDSKVLSYDPANRQRRVLTRFRDCILFFCKDVVKVEDLFEEQPRMVTGIVVPELSDFVAGHSVWRLSPDGTGTLMVYSAKMQPAFWVPPLIGTYLIRSSFYGEFVGTAKRIEHVSRRQNGTYSQNSTESKCTSLTNR